MLFIGNRIALTRPTLNAAVTSRHAALFAGLARQQIEAGAAWLLVDAGPQRRNAADDVAWLVQTVHAEVSVPLALRSDNPQAIEAGLCVARDEVLIDATLPGVTDFAPFLDLACRYKARLALPACPTGLPLPLEDRLGFVTEQLVPMALEAGLGLNDFYVDPLVTALTCDQSMVPVTVETLRLLKVAADQVPNTLVHLDDVADGAAEAARPYISQTYLTMLLAAGIDALVANPLDADLVDVLRVVRERDPSTAYDRLLLRLYDLTKVEGYLDETMIDPSDAQQAAVFKTSQVLNNQILYADSYLRA